MVKKLINLQSTDYEHPFDKAALDAMRNVPLFDSVVNFVLNWTSIKWHVVELCGSAFHVTKKSCPELFQLVEDTAKTLEVDILPEIYTKWTYGLNAYTTGYKKDTILVVYSGAVDLLPEPELKYIVGHEMGHIKSGHVLYHVMASVISEALQEMGILGKAAAPIQLALGYWNRMSEFTADRAGLLACQDLDAALSATMKMAGIPQKYFNVTNPHVFVEQAQEFLSKYGDTANTIIRNISVLNDSHPWTVLRAAELVKWVELGEYEKVLNNVPTKKCPMCKQEVDAALLKCPFCGYSDDNWK